MTTIVPAAPSTASTASELGALLAQHPVGWWLAGMLALALLGWVAVLWLVSRRADLPGDGRK